MDCESNQKLRDYFTKYKIGKPGEIQQMVFSDNEISITDNCGYRPSKHLEERNKKKEKEKGRRTRRRKEQKPIKDWTNVKVIEN